jgi:hypothetical protein
MRCHCVLVVSIWDSRHKVRISVTISKVHVTTRLLTNVIVEDHSVSNNLFFVSIDYLVI